MVNFPLLIFSPPLLYVILITWMFLYCHLKSFLEQGRKYIHTYTHIFIYTFTHSGFFSDIFSLNHHTQKRKCLFLPISHMRKHNQWLALYYTIMKPEFSPLCSKACDFFLCHDVYVSHVPTVPFIYLLIGCLCTDYIVCARLWIQSE